jgi:membrane protein DedA with SNARE-associated domain
MLHSLSSGLIHFISALGFWGIFIGMIIESACIPLPSEVIMLYGGFMVYQGTLSFFSVVAAGVLGNLVGSVIMYWIGSRYGRPVIERYGKYVLFNYEHLDKADRWFSKYGDWVTFFGRNLPVIRTFISLPAGIAKMPFGRFFIFTLIGSVPWNLALTFFGYKLGQHWEIAQHYLHPVTYLIAIVVVLLLIRYVYRGLKERQSK